MEEDQLQEEQLQENKIELSKSADEMEGGFAVVDRERLIEEETRGVTPWHKFFFGAFTEPSKMMEECYGTEPFRGASYGVVGCILFTMLYTFITFLNPAMKAATIDALRLKGVAEESLSQTYSVSMISGIIGGTVGVFFGVFITAVIVQIIKAIAKDKASFSNIYKMLLIVQMVATSIMVVDAIAAYFIGITGSVFQLGSLLGDISQMPVMVQAVCGVLSLSNVISAIWFVLGYRAITHCATKKAVIIMIIYQIFGFIMQIVSISMAQMAGGLGA